MSAGWRESMGARRLTVCQVGHRSFDLPGYPCAWCDVLTAGHIDVPLWLPPDGRYAGTFPIPITADEVLALSWWQQ